MKRLIGTKDLDQKAWLAARRQGVCGSDASIIMGINPYRSILELWKDKTGQIPIEEKENQYTYFGHVLEPVVKAEFMKRTKLKVRAKRAILQSQTHPFILADIDGMVKETDGSYAVFEAKTANEYKKEVWEKGIPEEYYAQVQHYLFVCEKKKAYVCCIVGGNSYFCHEVLRDDTYIEELIARETEFWECVLKNVAPKIDASKATEAYLNQQYGWANKTEIDLPEGAALLVDSYLEVESDLKKLTSQKTLLTNQLKEMLGENEKGRINGHIIKWSNVEKRTPDSKKIKEILGETYNDYTTVSQYRKFSVA